MKKFLAIIAAVLMAGALSAATYGPLTINDWKITEVKPTSFSSMDANLTLSLVNNGPRIVMSEISGIIYNKAGEMIIIGTANDMMIARGGSDVVIRSHGSLSSYSVLLSLMRNPSFNPEDYKIDVNVTVKMGAQKKHEIKKTGIPLSTFLNAK